MHARARTRTHTHTVGAIGDGAAILGLQEWHHRGYHSIL